MNIQEDISSLLFLIFFHINIGYYFETFLESEYIANLLTSSEDKSISLFPLFLEYLDISNKLTLQDGALTYGLGCL